MVSVAAKRLLFLQWEMHSNNSNFIFCMTQHLFKITFHMQHNISNMVNSSLTQRSSDVVFSQWAHSPRNKHQHGVINANKEAGGTQDWLRDRPGRWRVPPRIYLVLFKLREGIVRNEKIITAKMVTEPKSEKKKKKVNDSILHRMFLWGRNSLYVENKKIETQN